MIKILICIAICLLVFIIVVVKLAKHKSQLIENEIAQCQKEAATALKEQYNYEKQQRLNQITNELKEQKSKLEEKINFETKVLQEKHTAIISELETQEQEIKDDLAKQKQSQQEELQKLQQKIQNEVSTIAERKANMLHDVEEYYTDQKRKLDIDFEDYQTEIDDRRRKIDATLRKAEERQQELIDSYKRQEQIKQNQNFYRMVLSQNNIEDVNKLKRISTELHSPILYKLIYKEYYERPFNEMVGRVVSGRGQTGIYKITNILNGKTYIGQTKQTFKERWRTHIKRGLNAEPLTQNKLYNAMWEDGVENFTFEVLCECDVAELNEKEREYIQFYQSNTWGYNATIGNS